MASSARTSEPRYAQVAADLRAAIAAGDFGEGAQLPTENALCERYGISRFTVREALRRLQAEGLIRRRRGSGTVVDTGGQVLRQPISDLPDLLQYAADSEFRFVTHGIIAMGPLQADALGVPQGSEWAHLSGIRRTVEGGMAVAITDVFITSSLVPFVPLLKQGPRPLFQQLAVAAGFQIGRVEQDIRAIAAGSREAEALGVPRRTPILRIMRVYRDSAGRIVEISVSAHPGDHFTYSMQIGKA